MQSNLKPLPYSYAQEETPEQRDNSQQEQIEAWVKLLTGRISDLLRQLLSAESAQSIRFSEVEKRVEGMMTEVTRVNFNMKQDLEDADAIRQHAQQKFAEASHEISHGLITLEKSLANKLAEVSAVVKGLESVGKELELIATNAAIQAAHAGPAGRSFSVVAEHVRNLAKNTINNSKQVGHLLDFSGFQSQLIGFGKSSTDIVQQVDQETGKAFAKVEHTFNNIGGSLSLLVEHAGVIETMHVLNKASDAQRHKLTQWAQRIADEITEVPVGEVQYPAQMKKIVIKEKLYRADDYDRLEHIQQRGVLRVAIEPAFKGLSFRMRANEPLRGLDVEYSSAFAQYLGVNIEFVEHPWDQCVSLLHVGRKRGEPEVDVVWSALPPNAAYHGVAYSNTYTYLHYMLARRVGDHQIRDIQSLQGKVLGCINDPAAFATLESAGLRWSKHTREERGTIRLANLIGFTDQSVIHDALADGKVDAFAVDQPIFAWACYGQDSPWRGKIELIKGNIAPSPWYYAAAVAASPSSYQLLSAINQFLAEFKNTQTCKDLELRWQFFPVQGTTSYRDEPGSLIGESDLEEAWNGV